MLERIRYRLLMYRLRGEIARFARGETHTETRRNTEKMKTVAAPACKACGSIV